MVRELLVRLCVGSKGSASQLHSHESGNRQSGLHRGWSFLITLEKWGRPYRLTTRGLSNYREQRRCRRLVPETSQIEYNWRAVVGAELVRNPDVAKISFTGSVAVGESIMRDGAASGLHIQVIDDGIDENDADGQRKPHNLFNPR